MKMVKNSQKLVLFGLMSGSMHYSGMVVVAQSRHTAQASQKVLPASGSTFWQIEKFSDPLSGKRLATPPSIKMINYGHLLPFAGAQLQYMDKCLVKHMLTQKYLTVLHDGENQEHSVRYFL